MEVGFCFGLLWDRTSASQRPIRASLPREPPGSAVGGSDGSETLTPFNTVFTSEGAVARIGQHVVFGKLRGIAPQVGDLDLALLFTSHNLRIFFESVIHL